MIEIFRLLLGKMLEVCLLVMKEIVGQVTYGIATKNTLEWIINFFAVSSFLIFSLVLVFMLFLDFVVLGVL